MPYHQWDYLFAFGTIFAGLDAFNIGANDVANSFATSIASKSLTMPQATLAAAVMEFTGAVAVGARTADTIKNGIISSAAFQGNPGVQLLAFTVALSTSACWLMLCTYLSWPVSTTYSIVSAIAGVGVATAGVDAVQWGWNGGKGLATIFAGFLIAPAIAGGFGAVLYLLVKFLVLVRKNPVPYALAAGPVVFFLTSAVMTMAIIFKGSPSLGLDKMPDHEMAAAIVGTAAVVSLFSILFWLPYVHAKVVKKDYTLRFYHFLLGPALWFRQPPADAAERMAAVVDYRIRKEDATGNDVADRVRSGEHDAESGGASTQEKIYEDQESGDRLDSALNREVEKVDLHPIEGAWAEPKNLYIILRYKSIPFLKKIATHGLFYDIHAAQAGEAGTAEGKRINDMYSRATQYGNETEACFSFVQVLTACANSFAHGANDVSNAIGPYAVIYHVWKHMEISGKKAPVPIWILVYGGAMIVVGLATYGIDLMHPRNHYSHHPVLTAEVLGNKITLHSPSRGFSMELGAAITVILASQYGLPASTTMCITGSTVGVALCNGDLKSINWRAIAWIFSGWVLTVPIVGTLSGCLMGIILNYIRLTSRSPSQAPHFQ
ncbi:hypothetical protein JCM8097_006717 [Rhodosporidiobolus ruineniae]